MRKIGKIIFLSVICFIFLNASALYAIDLDPYKTEGYLNGKYWNTLSFPYKLNVIIGINSGIKSSLQLLEQLGISKDVKDKFKEFYFSGLVFEDAVKGIDKFYNIKSNCNIPIWEVFLYLCKKKCFTSHTSFEFNESEYIKNLRKIYNK